MLPYMNVEKGRIIMKAFIESQFEYCPLFWMFYNKITYKKSHHFSKICLIKIKLLQYTIETLDASS